MRRLAAALAILAVIGVAGAVFWRLAAFGVFAKGTADAATIWPAEAPGRLGAPDRPLRLVVLGTSLSHGGDWPDLLAARLGACREGGAEIRRVTRPGASIRWGSGALETALARGLEGRPDLLMAEFSINDASLAHGVPLEEARARLDALLARAAAAEVPVLLLGMTPAFGREGWERPGHGAYLRLYREAAEAGRAGFFDDRAAWFSLPEAARAEALPDRLHPAPAAMAELHVPALADFLAPRVCG